MTTTPDAQVWTWAFLQQEVGDVETPSHPEGRARAHRRRLWRAIRSRQWPIWLAILVAVLVLLVVWLLSITRASGAEIALEVAKATMSLLTAVIITGFVSYALTREAQRRTEASVRIGGLTSALQELKGAYEQLSVARVMLRANPSGRTFEQQLPAILGCRSRLQRIERDHTLENEALTGSGGPIYRMVKFTRRAGDFYEKNYSIIVRESILEGQLRETIASSDPATVPWPTLDAASLQDADFLKDLLSDGEEWDRTLFSEGYVDAKRIIETEIRRSRTGWR